MRLLLIRHGETDWNVEARIQGLSDVPLNTRGERQAALLAEALQREPVAAVYASPLQRARKTADAVATRLGLPVHTHAGLMELDQGIFEGMLLHEVATHPTGVLQAWEAGDVGIVIPGGESLEMLQQRAWAAVQAIRQAVPRDATVAVVSHNLTAKAILCAALDLPLACYRRFRKDNGSVSVLEFGQRLTVLTRLNDTSHVAGLAAGLAQPVP